MTQELKFCKECGESWFMTEGDELCKDCRRWEVSQRPEQVKARLDAAKFKRRKSTDDAPMYAKRR